MGPTNNVKNIEWWQVNDGAKRVEYFKVMSDKWQKLSDEKKVSKQALSVPLVVLSINLEFEINMKMLTTLTFDHNVHGFPTYHYGLNNIERHDVVVQ